MIPFWNPWDHGSAQGVFPGFFITIRMIRKVHKCPKTDNLEDMGYIDEDFFIITPHMIYFWNPWDHGSAQEVFDFWSPSG